MTVTIGRRELLAAFGGAAVVWPLPARAQQPARPVMGYLSIGSPDFDAPRLTGLRQGMTLRAGIWRSNTRWAGDQIDRGTMAFIGPRSSSPRSLRSPKLACTRFG